MERLIPFFVEHSPGKTKLFANFLATMLNAAVLFILTFAVTSAIKLAL